LRIEVDCERIKRNTEVIVKVCAERDIEVVGVTKACCGHPEVARAMLAGGVNMLAESRLKNVQRLREAGIGAHIMLLRLPCIVHGLSLLLISLLSWVVVSPAGRQKD